MLRLAHRFVLAALLLAGAAACTDGGGEGDEVSTPSTTDAAFEQCASPEGWQVSYPAGWVAKANDDTPGCEQFHPEAFTVEPNTDARVAAVTIFVDRVPFDVARSPRAEGSVDEQESTIDGRPALRQSYRTTGDGLWPAGTPVTRYLVDLNDGRTLFLDTVGLPGFDYERNVDAVDEMASTLEITS